MVIQALSSERQRAHLPARHSQFNSWLRPLNRLMCWSERSRERAALRDLADDRHLLNDLGLTRQEVLDEASKPFWK
jgi:uncharacterized protein YjiS (DUF1127 family)